MNLWHIFPESLLHIKGVLQLPYMAMAFYGYVIYLMVKHNEERRYLLVFLLLSLSASGIMLVSFGPQMGKMIAPFALLTVMIMPLVVLMVKLIHKTYRSARIWLVVTLAGWMHSISWTVWFFALAGS